MQTCEQLPELLSRATESSGELRIIDLQAVTGLIQGVIEPDKLLICSLERLPTYIRMFIAH